MSLAGAVAGCLFASLLAAATFTTTNWSSFTEIKFRFHFAPGIAGWATFFAVLMGLFVEVKVHVAGEWSRAGIAGGFAGWRRTRLSPRWCCDSERSSENQRDCTDEQRLVARL